MNSTPSMPPAASNAARYSWDVVLALALDEVHPRDLPDAGEGVHGVDEGLGEWCQDGGEATGSPRWQWMYCTIPVAYCNRGTYTFRYIRSIDSISNAT